MTVHAITEKKIQNEQYCSPHDTVSEDVEMAICLEKIGVQPGESRDAQEKHR